jgi:hypothetical protein
VNLDEEAPMLFAQDPPPAPAGGVALADILIAMALTAAVIGPVAWFVWRERAGKPTLIGRAADWVSSQDGLPRWVGLPSYLGALCILSCGFGVWWDVPLHMQVGRDEGAFANPSHFPIFIGILGFFSAGVISMALAKGPMPKRTFTVAPGWQAPMGSMVITAAGVIALLGFPLDDVWHRIFGQDVTEWGPTHIMMIGGATTFVLGMPLLHAEAHQLGARGTKGFAGKLRGALWLSLCIAPFAFLMEFDLGVPQFPAATQFIIAGFLTAWIFTAVRAYFGPGGALVAWLVYITAHLFLAATIALLQDVLVARFLLFLGAAIIVELVALVISPRRSVAFGLMCGALIGTLGMLTEWLWSGVFMPLPQPLPASTLPFLLAVGTAAALGGGLLGAWHVNKLALTSTRGEAVTEDSAAFPDLRFQDHTAELAADGGTFWRRHGTGIIGIGTFLALMAVFAPPTENPELSAVVELSDVEYEDGRQATECNGEERCMATVTVTVSPAEAAEDAIWLYGLAWQGRHGDVATLPRDPVSGAPGILRVEMIPTGVPGQYRSEHRLPLYGNWKTLIRFHEAPTVHMAVPIHAPDDPAIAAEKGRQILVRDGETVQMITESQFLQREIKDGVPGWLWTLAYAIVIASWLVLIAFYGWCYAQAAHGSNPTPARRRKADAPRTPRAEEPATADR